LTSTLHLSSREVSPSNSTLLADYLSTLPEEDQAVIAEVQGAGGDKAMVLINRGESKGSRFLITAQGASLGRSPESVVFLNDVTVSRVHAVIEKNGSDFKLRDCGSLNGTYVNNSSVSEVALHSGDQIQIGKFHLLFVCGNSKVKS
ncbi:MAG: FHA domain-containing protein, partial [Streptomycetaceae bacterium]